MKGALAWLLVFCFPVLVSAQPPESISSPSCSDLAQQTKLFGCMDVPAPLTELSRSAPVVITGWALSLHTGKQPKNMSILYGVRNAEGEMILKRLPRKFRRIQRRFSRLDVLVYYKQYGNISSPYLGYKITVKAGVFPLGENVLVVQFTDPTVGVGVNHQQVKVTFVP